MRRGCGPGAPPAVRFATAVLAVLSVLALVLLPASGAAATIAEADDGPSVRLSEAEAGAGGTITVTGKGWRPRTLLTLLICGQNMIGGTNACANADGRAVTTRRDGTFTRELPVAEPPKPCPCVVHVATVTGEAASYDAPLKVAGHPVAPLPEEEGTGRLAVLTARLEGSSGLLTWFGAPPQRRLVLTVANLGTAPARNPVFRMGTSHGVFAPQWEEQQWRGAVEPGKRARIELPVQLAAGAHGDYLVSLKYGNKVLTEQPWGVERPWGVTLFWVLLCVVVPAAVFRTGMAAVDRVRPHLSARTRGRDRTRSRGRTRDGGRTGIRGRSGRRDAGHAAHRGPRTDDAAAGAGSVGEGAAGAGEGAADVGEGATALPWFTPDTLPSREEQVSAPSEDRSSSKGSS
ncbi:hypothetical protein [Streptomyces sp. NPDC051776]|uniref:hypothetical protein n=1 Tax=Streptomyces sp. NPDC051776 TaxID=3155414 RepID=UPI00341B330B